MSKAKRAFEIFISLAILSLIVVIVFALLIVEKVGDNHTNTIVTAVFAGGFLLFVSVAMAVMMTHSYFKCSYCNMEFKGRPFQVLVSMHSPSKRLVDCPFCHNRCWCEHEIK